ncbi:hypothetical protein HDU91_002406 [Kappamyces sp. JEL0680]|nr:hypothetical protein HDU91_002406 [Kappamyces sp. JEL0680]
MTRHSKNANALAVFTYQEKQKLKGIYGTLNSRVGRDSMKMFDACSLCLATARTPMTCPEGHLYCKECIYNSILAQRKEIDEQTAVVEAHNQSVEMQSQSEKRMQEQKKVEQFIAQESNIVVGQEQGSSKGNKLQAFWLPENTPQADASKMTLSKKSPMCYAGKSPHLIR